MNNNVGRGNYMKRAMSAFAAAAALGIGLMGAAPAMSQEVTPANDGSAGQIVVVPDTSEKCGDNPQAKCGIVPADEGWIAPQDNIAPPSVPALDAPTPQTPQTPDTATNSQAAQEPDLFHPSFFDDFEVKACTSDSFTVAANIAAYASMSDWERISKTDRQIQIRFAMTAPPILYKAWNDVAAQFPKDVIEANGKDFKEAVKARMSEAAKEIESYTGISVLIMGGTKGPATPGCN